MRKHSKSSKGKKPFLNISKAGLSNAILDIQDKPDVAVWNKKARIRGEDKGKTKIGSLNQNLIREDTNTSVDPANKKSISDVVVSGAQVTDRVDLSKANRKNKK
jgi:hypothetical protein